MFSSFLILLIGLVVVGAAFFTVTRRNPIHAALSMLVSLAGVGFLMLALRSPFLAAMQVLLYGGAIMVLFVFVIMLLTLRDDELGPEPAYEKKLLGAGGAVVLLAVLFGSISKRQDVGYQLPHQVQLEQRDGLREQLGELQRRPSYAGAAAFQTTLETGKVGDPAHVRLAAEIASLEARLAAFQAEFPHAKLPRVTPQARKSRVDFGSAEHFARFLYTDYVVPFELITVLVMAAVAGVIVLARRPDKVSLDRTPLAARHHGMGDPA